MDWCEKNLRGRTKVRQKESEKMSAKQLQAKESVSIQDALLEVVSRKDIDPERLEKFLDLQIKMEERQAERALNEALSDFQASVPSIIKTKKGHNSSYAPLDEIVHQIRPVLAKVGLSFFFDVEPVNDLTSLLKTTVRHKGGASIVSHYYFARVDNSGSKNEAQALKSALSYAKRAGLESALGLVSTGEDDDAARATDRAANADLISQVSQLLELTKSDQKKFLSFIGAESVESLTEYQAKKAIHALKQKGAK